MFANHSVPTITGFAGRSDSRKGKRPKEEGKMTGEKKPFFQINLIKNMNVIIRTGVGMAMMKNIVRKARRIAVI